MAARKASSRRPGPRAKPRGQRAARSPRSTVLLRACLAGVAVLVGVLYYQPLSSYFETRSALQERAAEVTELQRERSRLQARLAESATVDALTREARRMGLVRPGEKLFIVKGIDEWRRAQSRAATVGRDG